MFAALLGEAPIKPQAGRRDNHRLELESIDIVFLC